MGNVWPLIEQLSAEDRALYARAGLPRIVRCYQCRDEFDADLRKPRTNRLGMKFCSESCRSAHRRALVRVDSPR